MSQRLPDNEFATAVSNFLHGAHVVFPECVLISGFKESWGSLTGKQYMECAVGILLDVSNSLWRQLKIDEKLKDPAISENSKEAIMSHVKNITEVAKEMYKDHIPEKSVAKVGQPGETPSFSFLGAFTESLMKLLTYVSELYPECVNTSRVLSVAKVSLGDGSVVTGIYGWMQQKLLDTWLSNIVPCDADIRNGVMEGLFSTDISLVKPIDMRTKWSDARLTQENKDHIRSIIVEMNTFAQYSSIIPTDMLEQIENIATSLATNNGVPNFGDIEEVCKTIYSKSSTDSHHQFMESIPKLTELCMKNMKNMQPPSQ